jgi:hypothetical protein
MRDIARFHRSPFKIETARFVKDLEDVPEEVKVWRLTSYGVRFCVSEWGDLCRLRQSEKDEPYGCRTQD